MSPMCPMCWFCSSPTCEGCSFEFRIYDEDNEQEDDDK